MLPSGEWQLASAWSCTVVAAGLYLNSCKSVYIYKHESYLFQTAGATTRELVSRASTASYVYIQLWIVHCRPLPFLTSYSLLSLKNIKWYKEVSWQAMEQNGSYQCSVERKRIDLKIKLISFLRIVSISAAKGQRRITVLLMSKELRGLGQWFVRGSQLGARGRKEK